MCLLYAMPSLRASESLLLIVIAILMLARQFLYGKNNGKTRSAVAISVLVLARGVIKFYDTQRT